MNVCYLVLAHQNPSHFGRLIQALAAVRASVFIHIDAQSPLPLFQHEVKPHNVTFIQDRIIVGWGGFSMIEATLKLLRAASTADHYDYYCLLSGSDYPLRPLTSFHAHLAQNSGREFISLTKIPNESAGKPLSRLTTLHLDLAYRSNTPLLRKLGRRAAAIVNKLEIQRDCSAPLQGMLPYGGSQWWTLSHAAVHYILDFIAAQPTFVRFFKYTRIPDESFFHTIMGNSPFAPNIARNITFVDWSRPQPPYPAIFDADHLNQLQQNQVLAECPIFGRGPLFFGRKFLDDSAALTDAVQRQLWGDHAQANMT